MAPVTWSPDSLADLEQIVRDLARYSGQAAERLSDSIIAASDRLGAYPYLGRPFPEANRSDVRVIIIRNYRMIYRLEHGNVGIVRILNAVRQIGPSDLSI